MNSRRVCPPVAAALSGGLDRPFVTDGQLMTPGGPAAGQHGAAVLCLHPGAEPVTLRTAVVVRLKCSLRHVNPSGMPTLPGGAIASATPWWRKSQYTGAPAGVSIRPERVHSLWHLHNSFSSRILKAPPVGTAPPSVPTPPRGGPTPRSAPPLSPRFHLPIPLHSPQLSFHVSRWFTLSHPFLWGGITFGVRLSS